MWTCTVLTKDWLLHARLRGDACTSGLSGAAGHRFRSGGEAYLHLRWGEGYEQQSAFPGAQATLRCGKLTGPGGSLKLRMATYR